MTAKSVEPPGDIPAVECVGLTHRYGDHTVVNDLDLRIERGEVFGLLGPNGAGKTTTIRLLTTLMPIQHGRVTMFGWQVGCNDDGAPGALRGYASCLLRARRSRRGDNTTIRYNLGYVPQQLSIEAALTGRQNVAWFARLFDVPRGERAERVEQVLAAMDLLDVADRLASGYSGGMVRRLELAQALVNRPALLILDEPTVGLDPIARDSVWERVRELRNSFGTTVLLTTHYMSEADVLCDRIALLHKGILRAVGSPADLKAALGPQATLEDVFRHHAGAGLDPDGSDGPEGGSSRNHAGPRGRRRKHGSKTEGGLRGVRNTRRTAQRAG